MTANELADKLQNEKANTLLYVATVVDCANMLRQQAQEIEELKNDKNIDQMSKNDKNIDQMSKPVAWMNKEGYVYGKHSTRPIEADIPLYTKPFFSQKPVAMMVKMDGFDKPEFTTICSSAALKHPNYTALYDHPPIAFAELEAGESIPLYEHSETVEDRESAIYATGYWNGIQKAKEKNETLDTRSYLIGRYDGLRELSGEEIDNIFGISALNTTVNLTTKQCYLIVDAILKKASVNK
jgi:hypothetical protein